MIRNKLSELLSERGLKISHVAKATKIARSSLTSMVQNDSEMIRYDAINKLCNHLNIAPTDFFDYSPLDFEFTFDDSPVIDIDINDKANRIHDAIWVNEFSFEVIVEMKVNNQSYKYFDLNVELSGQVGSDEKNKLLLWFQENNRDELQELKDHLETLSAGLKKKLYKNFKDELSKYSKSVLENHIPNDFLFLTSNGEYVNLKKYISNFVIAWKSAIITPF
ncbi:helix-turn-helix domain-containing protein [Staphylococcus pseudintermedius]|uniref:helix-turn-helix domain-containing protein n=1 Tax=Staphylococcus pseudintermedius TaxID=283734 RepID=UPI002927674E|nr:helix-turn-helix transcriptional regulator [Staphylococcus pseudintermedius]MDU9259856.1 helix-turn-helix transcriptional regulator [Staphylococcus pseudintermedius]MDU9297410.1 helix-turn-helix transcriptional regulator [Staphylococcus pseudintermedius]MDU9298890.1 helix-turn-helix transcriptional regulator [Staphylococcus pseudintermedius]MDU9301671.1 helix-turn-helix transcriptional regulator [Staphylococcus pseudintermedius]